jgi:hypothetical protein
MYTNTQDFTVFTKPFESFAKSAEPASEALRTIALESTDYAKRSIENASAQVQKMSGVKDFGEAVKLQSEYAQEALDGFVAQSQKISGLFSDLVKSATPAVG